MPKITTKKQFDWWRKLRIEQGYTEEIAEHHAMHITNSKDIRILNDEIIKLKKTIKKLQCKKLKSSTTAEKLRPKLTQAN